MSHFGCTPSPIGTPFLEIRLTSVEIGTLTSGFGSPSFDLLFPILQFKNQKFGIGWDNPDIIARKFIVEARRGVLPMRGGVLRNPTCQVLNSKFRDRKPKSGSGAQVFGPFGRNFGSEIINSDIYAAIFTC